MTVLRRMGREKHRRLAGGGDRGGVVEVEEEEARELKWIAALLSCYNVLQAFTGTTSTH